jgi:hypothetical protein
MFKKVTPAVIDQDFITRFPHCDQRILHARGECRWCDLHPEWQALRVAWGIAFTGYTPEGKELPDPATAARGTASLNSWDGNRAKHD